MCSESEWIKKKKDNNFIRECFRLDYFISFGIGLNSKNVGE